MAIVKEYYDSGALKAKGRDKSGLKEGKWTFYFESGEVQSIPPAKYIFL